MSIRWLVLTVGGLGAIRPAPGTWGSTPPPALTLLAVWGLTAAGRFDEQRWMIEVGLIVIGVAFAWACVAFGGWAEKRWAGKDPSSVVADEVAGQVLPLLWLPWRAMDDAAAIRHDLLLAAIAFAAFRFFDIVKVPPARGLQRVPGGWGILVDDLVAGVYAAVVTQVVVRVLL